MAPVDPDEELPDAADLGEPPPLDEVMDDLAMRFVVNCPAEEQESSERLLFQVEAAFWFYEDQYREIWPHAFPTLNLLTFSQQMFGCCPLLKAFEHRTKEIYDAFTSYKQQIPTCGAMLLNSNSTKLLLVKGWHAKCWGFPKGKIDKDEDKEHCAAREVLEEVGYDCMPALIPTKYIEMQWRQQTIRLYVVPGVPDDYPFATRTKKEISEIAWHKLKDIPTDKDKEDANSKEKAKYWMVIPFVAKLRRFLAAEQQHAKKTKNKQQPQPPASAPAPSAEPVRVSGSSSGSSAKVAKGADAKGSAKAPPPSTAPAPSTNPPLGVETKGTKKGAAAAAAAPSAAAAAPSPAAAPSSVQVLQRRGSRSAKGEGAEMAGAAARPRRGHPWLDFAFDRQPLLDAISAAG